MATIEFMLAIGKFMFMFGMFILALLTYIDKK
ncbi:putative holin-like toxin [Terribacillus sp. DMT04]|nr:putative holin-like toxin [Terribacillus sp. DMT04]